MTTEQGQQVSGVLPADEFGVSESQQAGMPLWGKVVLGAVGGLVLYALIMMTMVSRESSEIQKTFDGLSNTLPGASQ
jgi:hypothetical protein